MESVPERRVAYLEVLAVQALDTSYSAERKGKPIAARPSTMGLACEDR